MQQSNKLLTNNNKPFEISRISRVFNKSIIKIEPNIYKIKTKSKSQYRHVLFKNYNQSLISNFDFINLKISILSIASELILITIQSNLGINYNYNMIQQSQKHIFIKIKYQIKSIKNYQSHVQLFPIIFYKIFNISYMSQDNIIIKSNQYWKNLRIYVAKNSQQNLLDSIPKFQEIYKLAFQIIENEQPPKVIENLFVQLFTPIARIVLAFQCEQIDCNFMLYKMIQILIRVACIYLKKSCNIKYLQFLLLVTDMKKTLYKEIQRKKEKEVHQQEKNNNIKDKHLNGSTYGAGCAPAIHSVNLQPIKQDDEYYNEIDRKLSEQNPQKKIIAIKRQGYKQFYSKIVQKLVIDIDVFWYNFENKTPEYIQKYIELLKNISRTLHRNYLVLIFDQIKAALWDYFVNIDENNIRNVTAQNNQLIFSHLLAIFDRIGDQNQKNKWTENFLVESSIPLIRCKLLKKKLIGLKSLAHLSTQIYLGNSKFIKQRDHKNWLKQKKIFDQIFTLQSHEQVLQFGGDILKFIVRNNALELDELAQIFTIIQKGDYNMRKVLLKIVNEVTLRFGYKQSEYILTKVKNFNPEILSEEMIDVIYQISKYSTNSHNYLGMEIYWRFFQKNFTSYKFVIQDKLISKYIDLFKHCLEKSTMTKPQLFFDEFIQFFQETKKVHVLKFIKRVLDQFPQTKQDIKYICYKKLDYELIGYIVQKHQLHNKIITILDHSDSQQTRQDLVDILSYIIRKYKQHFNSQYYLNYQILLNLTKYPKIFSQLLILYYSEYSALLYQILTGETITSVEMLQCIRELFYQINKQHMIPVISSNDKYYEINIIPKELNGYHKLFEIILNSQNQMIIEESANYICALYSNYINANGNQNTKYETIIKQFIQDTLQNIIKEYKLNNLKKVLAYLAIIQEMMNQTQKKGVGNLTAHSSLVNTESVKLTILNEITYGYDIIKKLQIKYPSNKTLFELLTYAGHQFKCAPSEILLKSKDKEIKQKYNGFTIQQLNLRDLELVAHRRATEQIPKQNLLIKGKFTQKAKNVFTELFYRFSPSGKMTATQLAKFVEGSTNDSCSVNDYRVNQVFSKFDDDKDGILILQNFLGFFQQSSRTRESTVWRNLESLRYRNDLRRYEDVKIQIQYKNTARYIIFKCDQIYEILFSALSDELLRNKCTRLLKRLPTYPKVLHSITNKFEFNSEDEFSIWYKLTIIQSLLITALEEKSQENKKNEQKIKQVKESEKKGDELIGILHLTSVHSQNEKNIDNKKIEFQKVLEINQAILQKQQPQLLEFNFNNKLEAVQFRKKFLQNKYYIIILQQALRISQNQIKLMNNITKSCLALSLQILRSLNGVPNLAKQLPLKFNLDFIELPQNNLDLLIPKLYEYMISQLFEPLLCLLLMKKQINLNLVLPGLFHKDLEVRIISNNFLYLYSRLNKQRFNIFNIQPEQNCKQFFNIIVRIINQDDKLQYQQIFLQLFNDIKNYQIKDQFNIKKQDFLFQGKLKILNSIINLKKEYKINHEFQQIILQKLHQVVDQQIRSTIYLLLLRTSLNGVIAYINNTLLDLIQPKKNQIFARNTYIGLYNLGCICYMNSILQQFFMIPQFRNPILSTQIKNEIAISQNKGKKYHDNIIYQLQKMFCFMLDSRRHQYNPEQFCYAFKKDINLGVQEDAQQFLNMVFEKIQNQVKSSHFSNLINDVFGGKTIVTIICQNCKKPKYKIEQFNNLSLQVKHLKNIDQSLLKFIDKETISDYFCQNCQVKVQVTTRETHLNSLPNILVMHLQRIIFSYQTFERLKIHNKFEFPNILNLKKFVKVREGQFMEEDDQFYQYLLKGVVIHSGNAQSGHYYSLIRETNNWYKFDDSRVSQYKFSEIGDEAFGGKQQYNDWGYGQGVRSKNAYLLVYEKKIKKNIVIKNLNTQSLDYINKFSDVYIVKKQLLEEKEAKISIQIQSTKPYINQQFKSLIANDNNIFLHQLQFYHPNFNQFVKNVLNRINFPQEILELFKNQISPYYHPYLTIQLQNQLLIQDVIKLIFKMIDILMKIPFSDSNFIKELINHINLAFFIMPQLAMEWFLNIDFKKVFEIVYTHSDQTIRQFYRSIIVRCFRITIALKNVDFDSDAIDQTKSQLLEYLRIIKSLLFKQIPKNLMKSQQYFEFWRYFINSMNLTCVNYCLQNQFIALFIDFILQKQSPILLQQNPRNYDLTNKLLNSTINEILNALFSLIISSKSIINNNSTEIHKHMLTQNQIKCLSDIAFYHKMIELKQDWKFIANIISYEAENNEKLSELIAAVLIQGVNKSDGFQIAFIYIMIINHFMLIKDELVQKRLQWIFGVPQYILSGQLQYSIKNTLFNQTISYVSSLYFVKSDVYKSVLELLYIQRKTPDNFIVIGIKTLLNVIAENEIIMDYIVSLPPPSYYFSRYTDWIYEFLDNLRIDSYITMYEPKDKIIQQCLKILEKIQKKLQSIITQINKKETQTEFPDYQNDETQFTKFEVLSNQNNLQQINHIPQNNNKIKQNKQILLISPYPQYIIGRNHHLQYNDPFQIINQHYKIIIKPIINYTFVLQSMPIGKNNLALSKQLFEDHLNYQKHPLKYFVQKEQSLQIQEDQQNPQYAPTIITLIIQNTVDITINFTDQRFNYSIYLLSGQHKINTPFIREPLINWMYINVQKDTKNKAIQTKKIQIQKNVDYSSAGSLNGPYMHYQNNPSSNYQVKERQCPDCTYLNVGLSYCEVCGCNLLI